MGKYRIPSARHPEWDYTSNGAYFVTICTKNRVWYFGNAVNEQMILNEIGEIVANEEGWPQTAMETKFVGINNKSIQKGMH